MLLAPACASRKSLSSLLDPIDTLSGAPTFTPQLQLAHRNRTLAFLVARPEDIIHQVALRITLRASKNILGYVRPVRARPWDLDRHAVFACSGLRSNASSSTAF